MKSLTYKRVLTGDRLAEILADNPGSTIMIDNDSWWVSRYNASKDHHEGVISDHNLDCRMPSGNCHGRDVLVALAEMAGVKVEFI